MEFGGIKGKVLSAQTVQIFEEFNELYKVFTEVSYDCLDPQDDVSFIRSKCHISRHLYLCYLCRSFVLTFYDVYGINFSLQQFPQDYDKFKESIADLDRRLASIVCQGFDDCSGLEAVFKLLDIFGSLLERPLIKEDFDANYPKIVTMMEQELNVAKQIYDENMTCKNETGKVVTHKNMAKVSGSLRWAQELRERISVPMGNFKHIEHP